MDITGDGAIEFFTNRIKITSKWPAPSVPEYVVGLAKKQRKDAFLDHANFAGTM
jgi:malonate-semialdehyde dehydrogenase (acetylating)/methylmalonate-semialdehyde dehydrogenase